MQSHCWGRTTHSALTGELRWFQAYLGTKKLFCIEHASFASSIVLHDFATSGTYPNPILIFYLPFVTFGVIRDLNGHRFYQKFYFVFVLLKNFRLNSKQFGLFL